MATKKKSGAKKSTAKKSTAKKSTSKKAAPKKSGGGGLGPIYSKLSKLEAHQKGQDRALMVLAENADQHERRLVGLERSRDEIFERLGDAGAPKGWKRFSVVG
jgi:hypothetical protein